MSNGQIAYEAWRAARGREFFDDPQWEEMCSDEQAPWEAVGTAVAERRSLEDHD